MRFALLAVTVMLLSSCASLTEEECRAGDWRSIGLDDGTRGRSPDFLATHVDACASYQITPDASAWESGRLEGLALYCTPESAYENGAKGRRLRPVCPASDHPALSRSNSKGLMYYEIGQDIDDIERDIRALNIEIAALPQNDPALSHLLSERSRLRLDLLTLRSRRALYRH